jgi:hypothetical protein
MILPDRPWRTGAAPIDEALSGVES